MDTGQSWADRRGLYRARRCEPCGIVIHTTGSGPWKRWERKPGSYQAPYDAARRVYEGFMRSSPHFLICGETGRSVLLNKLRTKAEHVGSAGAWKYRLDGWPGRKDLAWWFRRFPGLASPRELMGGALWTKGSANEVSVGVEIAPPVAGPRAAWTDACWETLRGVVDDLCVMLGIAKTTEHVVTHSDVHPLARSTGKGFPWDPGTTQWSPAEAAEKLGLV